jgi:hypothetical protein
MFIFVLYLVYLSRSDEGYLVTHLGAYCWFADPRAFYYENPSKTIRFTYIGYIDSPMEQLKQSS